MSDSERTETQAGRTVFTQRLKDAGLSVIDRHRYPGFQRATYFAIGNEERQTDISISDTFLDDLPNTKSHQVAVDSYVRAVAGRLKCGSPEVFYCRSGVAIRISFQWPIQVGMNASAYILFDAINQVDGQIARCSMQVGHMPGHTVFDTVVETVNSVRIAIDDGLAKFFNPDVHQESFQRIERQHQPSESSISQSKIEQFLIGKAYVMGFLAANDLSDVWALDPWDAQYLGVSKKELSLGLRVLRAKGLLRSTSDAEYAQPTDKLLAEWSSENQDQDTFSRSQQKLSRLTLPNKEELLKDMRTVLQRHPISALLVIDIDNFKSVNDTKGHPKGDECLDVVVRTIGTVVGRKGRIYRWGSGDEFAVCLPDFSTEEAQATAERIRREIEEARPGGEIDVTASIGVCGSDRANSQSADEILEFADKAMYQSKRSGKNQVTSWPCGAEGAQLVGGAEKPTKQAVKAQLAVFLKEGREIQNGLHYSNFDSLRQKQEWEQRIEKYLEKNLDGSYAVRFQTPGHPPTTYPEGINSKMMAPWADTGARMAMLNSFIAEIRE